MRGNTNYLTAIRGFACLLVIIAHILSGMPYIGINVAGTGKIGVWLFFILSAFLLTIQWLDKKEVKKVEVIKFYIKRFFRIFPCYIVVLITAFLIKYIPNIETLIKHIFLLEGMGHFWTIPVEFMFYLIIPLIIYIMFKIKNKKLSTAFLILLFIITELISPYTKSIGNSINLRWYLPVFIMGMLTAIIFKKNEQKKLKPKIICDITVLIVLTMMLISVPYIRNIIFGIPPDDYLSNKYLFFGLGWSIIILAIQNSKYIINILNKSKVLIYIGKISFPLYLVHYIVLSKISSDTNIIAKFIIVFLISFTISIIMNKLIEQPMIKLSKKINSRIERKEKQNGKF